MDLDINVDIREVAKLLENLPKAAERKASRSGLAAGGRVIAKAAANNVKGIVSNEGTGTLARNIRTYSAKKLRGQMRQTVQVRKGSVNIKKLVNGEPVRVGLYGSVLEYGKANQPPRTWIRKAAQENTQQALEAFRVAFAKKVNAMIEDAKR